MNSNTLDSQRIIPEIIKCLNEVIPPAVSIPLHEPFFGGEEWECLRECLSSGFVSSIGPFVDTFEKKLAEFTGAQYAIAVVNGTSALHISLKISGVKEHDEVIVPAMTFVATANAVTYCNATPHFADISSETLCLDPRKLHEYLTDIVKKNHDGDSINRKTGQRIKAVVVVHSFGHPADMDSLLIVCDEFNLELIEDAAESLGSYYKGQHTGTIGTLGTLSFNGNKIITTGGGGAILTNDPLLAKTAKHLTTTAKIPHPWRFFHDQAGYNYRMPNLNAALGCAQLDQLPKFLAAKRALAKKYSSAFERVKGVTFFLEPSFATSNYWLNALLIDPALAQNRDELLDTCNQLGFRLRPAWELMHTLPMYTQCPRMDLSTAETTVRCLINLPSSVSLMIGPGTAAPQLERRSTKEN